VNLTFKQAIAATSGTILQWYDFSLFGYLAPTIAVLFFPDKNPIASLLFTFGVFAVSFLLAPLGCVFFGYIGDNFGRKKALTLSILAMAIPTALISVLPTHQQIGLIAAVLLTALRITQGLAASAEFAGSAIFLIEHAKSTQKCFYGSLTSSAYSVGSTLAALATALATISFMPTWAWRIPFALALIAGLLIFYMRKNINETPEFNKINQPTRKKTSFLTALKKYPASVLYTASLGLFVGIITFGTYVYATTYMNIYSQIPLSTAIAITSIALLVDAFLEPFIAILADKWGGRIIAMLGMIGFIIFTYPIFQLLGSGNTHYAIIGMILLSCLIALSCAPMNAFLISLFPAECRYSGFAVSFNITIALSGSVPLLMTWLIYHSHNILAPAGCYIVGGIVGLIAMQKAKTYDFSENQENALRFIPQQEN
jgi:MHS family proline/betaine transporter-like MFS transporter